MYDPNLVASMLRQLDDIQSQGFGDIPLVTLVDQLEYDALVREFPLSRPVPRLPLPGPPGRSRSKRMNLKSRRKICTSLLIANIWSDGFSVFVMNPTLKKKSVLPLRGKKIYK